MEFKGKALALESSDSQVLIRAVRIERARTKRWSMEELRPMEGTPRGQQHSKEKAEEMSLKVRPRRRGMKLARPKTGRAEGRGYFKKAK